VPDRRGSARGRLAWPALRRCCGPRPPALNRRTARRPLETGRIAERSPGWDRIRSVTLPRESAPFQWSGRNAVRDALRPAREHQRPAAVGLDQVSRLPRLVAPAPVPRACRSRLSQRISGGWLAPLPRARRHAGPAYHAPQSRRPNGCRSLDTHLTPLCEAESREWQPVYHPTHPIHLVTSARGLT
jgi:hypothetical protein